MEQHYSHHHVTRAHHVGVATGTIIGSFAVTVILALATVLGSRSIIDGSLNLGANLVGAEQSTQPAQPGAASQIEPVFPQTNGALGGAAQATNQIK